MLAQQVAKRPWGDTPVASRERRRRPQTSGRQADTPQKKTVARKKTPRDAALLRRPWRGCASYFAVAECDFGLDRVKPPQFFQFRRQAMAERAFGAEVIQQGFRLLEDFLSQFSPLMQHPAPRARHFLFGEQATTPNQMRTVCKPNIRR